MKTLTVDSIILKDPTTKIISAFFICSWFLTCLVLNCFLMSTKLFPRSDTQDFLYNDIICFNLHANQLKPNDL